MKRITPLLFAVLAMFVCTSISAQDANPEVARYAKMFDLDEMQVQQLTDIYAETAEREVAIKEKISALRTSSAEVRNSPEESAKWKSDMNTLSDERRTIRKDREAKMVALFNEEQLNIYNKWKDGSLNRDELKQKMTK
jgi:hypothetical protein